MTSKIQGVRGMNDILPEETPLWAHFEAVVQDWLDRYGYREIRLPIVEPTALFVRSIGAVTDIVEKEMYTFVDSLNGESLSLRPEGTASCIRAALEHNLLYGGAQRLWYGGPMFRHERPQKGRYRQFHQFGVEALGYAGPDIDAEHIVMSARLWRLLGLTDLHLELNTLGDSEARARYRVRLIDYFERAREVLGSDEQRRLNANPLRILDSKNPALQQLIADAPRLLDDIDAASRAHFEALQQLLREAGVGYRINARLVRGLDYYNATVFEWVSDRMGAQAAVCAGGRYDGLVEQLGGKPTPGCGFAMGVERLIALMKDAHSTVPAGALNAYLVHQGEGALARAFTAADRLRAEGAKVIVHCGQGSIKAQMKKADTSGARFAIIIGEEEMKAGTVSVKPLRGQGEQVALNIAQASALIKQQG